MPFCLQGKLQTMIPMLNYELLTEISAACVKQYKITLVQP